MSLIDTFVRGLSINVLKLFLIRQIEYFFSKVYSQLRLFKMLDYIIIEGQLKKIHMISFEKATWSNS